MKIERLHTTVGVSVRDSVRWVERPFGIAGGAGDSGTIEAPESWSLNAVNIIATKYARRAGVPSRTEPVPEPGVPDWLRRSVAEDRFVGLGDTPLVYGRETSIWQIIHRLAGCWTYHGWQNHYFDAEEDARAFYDEACFLLLDQRFAPNSPQFFNTGLHWVYGITRPADDHWRVNPATGQVEQTDDAYATPQAGACFILGVDDNLCGPDGIMDTISKEALIFKYGSGSGTNFSNLRGAGEPLSGGGYSSGMRSFSLVNDRAAGSIKSGGTVRRAATMRELDDDHPDIEWFIGWKTVEERKVAALVTGSKIIRKCLDRIVKACDGGGTNWKANPLLRRALRDAIRLDVPRNYLTRTLQLYRQGIKTVDFPVYETDYNGEAYATVAGQNSNNSVSIHDHLLQMVEQGEGEWPIYWRTELRQARDEGRQPVPQRTPQATDLFNQICRAAWETGDPGLQFNDRMNEWHPCPHAGKIAGTNPCGEYLWINNSSCNLASLNLVRFYDFEQNLFRVDDYKFAVGIVTMVLDITVTMAQYPSRKIAENTWDYRTLGLGYANLGGLLMRMGIPYASEAGRAWAGGVTALLHAESRHTTVRMAADPRLGPFPGFAANREPMLRVMRNHIQAARGKKDVGDYEGLTILPVPLDRPHLPTYFLAAIDESYEAAYNLGERHGYRNAQTNVEAPTGTINLAMDCDTSGVEPGYGLVVYKKLAGGGMMRIVNESVLWALRRLKYTNAQCEDIVHYIAGHGTFDGCAEATALATALRLHSDAKVRVEGMLRMVEDVTDILTLLGPEVLQELGVDEPYVILGNMDQQDAINRYVLGHETVEGAPHLRPEHYAVFDGAVPGKRGGTRYLTPEDHVRTVAAVQPFMCGGISKSVNVPESATIADMRQIYLLAWRLGIKCIALYRDKSKLSEPLGRETFSGLPDERDDEVDAPPPPVPTTISTHYRERLPNPAPAETHLVKVGGQSIFVVCGKYHDGRLGQLAIDAYSDGSPMQLMFDLLGKFISYGLQWGVPLHKFTKQMLYMKFDPQGKVERDPTIMRVNSIIDYVARMLAIRYDHRDDLKHIVPGDDETAPTQNGAHRDVVFRTDDDTPWIEPQRDVRSSASNVALVQVGRPVLSGIACPACHQIMTRTGTCFTCPGCGTSSGGCQ